MLLLSPVLLYLFLHFFGENHYDLPVYFERAPTQPHRSLSEIACMSHAYPYKVFEHPSGRNLHKKGTSLYIIHNIASEQDIKTFTALYEEVEKRNTVQIYGIVAEGHSFSLPAIYYGWSFKELTPSGSAYLRDCVLHIMDLFEQESSPEHWAILLDAEGYIRGSFDPSDDKDLNKGRTEAFIIQDLIGRLGLFFVVFCNYASVFF